MGPFSLEQQLYAARLPPYAGVSLFGVRTIWNEDSDTLHDRYSLALTDTKESAVALVGERFRHDLPHVDVGTVIVEVDDTRLETVSGSATVYATSRQSRLDLPSYVHSFGLSAIEAS